MNFNNSVKIQDEILKVQDEILKIQDEILKIQDEILKIQDKILKIQDEISIIIICVWLGDARHVLVIVVILAFSSDGTTSNFRSKQL